MKEDTVNEDDRTNLTNRLQPNALRREERRLREYWLLRDGSFGEQLNLSLAFERLCVQKKATVVGQTISWKDTTAYRLEVRSILLPMRR
jgi:hypothetical protein